MFIDHSDRESDLVDDFELRPVVGEILEGEVELLSATLAQDEHLCVGILLVAGVSFVDREFEVFVGEFEYFLVGVFGDGSDVFDEDGDAEVVF